MLGPRTVLIIVFVCFCLPLTGRLTAQPLSEKTSDPRQRLTWSYGESVGSFGGIAQPDSAVYWLAGYLPPRMEKDEGVGSPKPALAVPAGPEPLAGLGAIERPNPSPVDRPLPDVDEPGPVAGSNPDTLAVDPSMLPAHPVFLQPAPMGPIGGGSIQGDPPSLDVGTDGRGPWRVQVLAALDLDRAEWAEERVRAAGASHVAIHWRDGLYKVMAGGFYRWEDAADYRDRLRAHGFGEAAVTRVEVVAPADDE